MTINIHLWPLTAINQVLFQSDVNFSNEVNFTFWNLSPSYNLTSEDLWPWYVTFDCMNIQKDPYCINKPSFVPIGLIFQMKPLSHLAYLNLRWPLTLIRDLWPYQQMRVPMLHLWPNFGWNPGMFGGFLVQRSIQGRAAEIGLKISLLV